LIGLRTGLGPAWSHTVVLAVTEFGRTVHANGTGGTDHGTASVALLAGGAVAGGVVHTDWPGLAANHLHEGRDLAATTDIRAIFKGVLMGHMGLDRAQLEDRVFRGTGSIEPLVNLTRQT
jgi:uncharacterized protein (DUF1501 family)